MKLELGNSFTVETAARTTRSTDFLEGKAAIRLLSGGKLRMNKTAMELGFSASRWVTPFVVNAGDQTYHILAVTNTQQEPKSNSFCIKVDRVASSRLSGVYEAAFNTSMEAPYLEVTKLDADQAKALTRCDEAFVVNKSAERLSEEEVARIKKLIASRPADSFGKSTAAATNVEASAPVIPPVVSPAVTPIVQAATVVIEEDEEDIDF